MCYEKVRLALGWVKSSLTQKIEGSSHHFIWRGLNNRVQALLSHATLPERSEGPQKVTLGMYTNPLPTLVFNDVPSSPAPSNPNKTKHNTFGLCGHIQITEGDGATLDGVTPRALISGSPPLDKIPEQTLKDKPRGLMTHLSYLVCPTLQSNKT